MKVFLHLAMLTMVVTGLSQQALAEITLTSTFSAQIEEDEIDAFGTDIDQAFFNVQGDDDAFTVYSLVDFSTAGIGLVSDITSASLSLTQSNAFFTADGELEFFLASDTRDVTLADTARFVADGDNLGAEVVGDAFGTLFSLGTGTFTETATGDTDVFTLDFDDAATDFAVSQINSGGLLRIIATPGDLGVQATFSGASSLLAPPSPPTLALSTVAVPEPSSVALLGLAGLGLVARRRRR